VVGPGRVLKQLEIAGATARAVPIPSAMACTSIVGAGPIVGLSTIPPTLAAYAVFGGVGLLVAGPDTTTTDSPSLSR
jgi:MFS superfamily sulfate permease-like transporter